MSQIALFALGAGVSLIAFTALALLVVGAVLDGRDERARRDRASDPVAGQLVPFPTREGEAA
jgi:hypothetical protein